MWKTARQFGKFGIVGVLNTLVDFTVLNVLIFLFGISEKDWRFTIFKALAFSAAVANSYIFNRSWVFNTGIYSRTHEIGRFVAVSVAGLLINTAVAYGSYRLGHIIFPDVSSTLLATGAAAVGIVIVMITNFVGYKFLVFKK